MPLYRLGIDQDDGELLFRHDSVYTNSEFQQICNECIIEANKKDILKHEYDFISAVYPFMGKLTKSDKWIDLIGSYGNLPDITDEMKLRGFTLDNEYPTAFAHIEPETVLSMPEVIEFARKYCEDNGKIYSTNECIPDISASDMEIAQKILNEYR